MRVVEPDKIRDPKTKIQIEKQFNAIKLCGKTEETDWISRGIRSNWKILVSSSLDDDHPSVNQTTKRYSKTFLIEFRKMLLMKLKIVQFLKLLKN